MMHDRQTGNDCHLRLEGISRRFGNVKALDDVSLGVGRGALVCLVGHSGCGKSSLLRIVAGIDRPDEGRVLLDGREVSGSGGHVEPEDRNIGFMFQDYALFPHLNVTDNILFGLRRIGRRAARERCAAIVARLGLDHLARRFPHMLSGGEQQRVALARALAPQPDIVLMDEPFSNLDRELRNGIRTETIDILRELGTTVIMVTHDPEEALSTGDVIVLMRNGKIVQSASGAEIYEHPASPYAAEFFCSFNKIRTVCRNGCAETPLGRFAAPGFAEGEHATVYIRPQCLRVNDAEGVDCTVVDCALFGEIEQMHVAVAALSEPLRIRSTRRSRLSKGDSTRLAISPEQILIF
ncbi:MAG: ABC transporter ATP-binding protein [Pseudochelatococcus sp.]|jgi:iron(III) transport system ATP-binding protein|uniref:ABC transporter ATP-binding protein n=1 Tax=Pseudochelatococcus sp. TaxID=2020869 RepID=UPI003D907F8B